MPAGILIPEAVCTCRCSVLVERRKKGDMKGCERKRKKEKRRGGEGRREKRRQNIRGEVRKKREERKDQNKIQIIYLLACYSFQKLLEHATFLEKL